MKKEPVKFNNEEDELVIAKDNNSVGNPLTPLTTTRRRHEREKNELWERIEPYLYRGKYQTSKKEGLIEKLPAVELFPEDNERDRVLTEAKFVALYIQAAPYLKPILPCTWETGMRTG
jgi:hypothetical protein